MQIRDLIEQLQRFDPADDVVIVIRKRDDDEYWDIATPLARDSVACWVELFPIEQ